MSTPQHIKEFTPGEPGLVPPDRLNEILRTLQALNLEVQSLKGQQAEPFRFITTYLFRPDATFDRGGVYDGVAIKLSQGKFNPDDGTDYELEDLGEADYNAETNPARRAIGINLSEIGSTGHGLTVGDDAPLYPAMLKSVNPDGRPVLMFTPGGGVLFGKVASYTAGANTVSLTPCDSAGTAASGAVAVTVYIELPTTKTVSSFFSGVANDVVAYMDVSGVKFLVSHPRPHSTTKYDVFQITATNGQGGFDSVRIK